MWILTSASRGAPLPGTCDTGHCLVALANAKNCGVVRDAFGTVVLRPLLLSLREYDLSTSCVAAKPASLIAPPSKESWMGRFPVSGTAGDDAEGALLWHVAVRPEWLPDCDE